MNNLASFALAFLFAGAALATPAGVTDHTYYSKVFGETRHYRLILPPDYASSNKRYPVIYYFHGHSDRYTVEKYDSGQDTIPKMVAYVAAHPVVVVCVDGYVAADYTGFYGGTPYDVMKPGGDHDFGPYFLELVELIDTSYRTLTDRRHRATSGLSMGGFMSLYLSARYPELIGSASAFNPGPEFYTGEKGRRELWRPKDHVAQHAQTMIRLIRASGDYISQYHEETRLAYARAGEVDFEFRQDEYHRHWATSIGETFAFHQRAFENKALDEYPRSFRYASAYRNFEPWGYKVDVAAGDAAFTYLEDVSRSGMRVTTRRWAVDGPCLCDAHISITTAGLYEPGAAYQLTDLNLATGAHEVSDVKATADGRLQFRVDGRGHQIGILGPGVDPPAPVLLPVSRGGDLRVDPGPKVQLPVRIYNPRVTPIRMLTAVLTTEYPTAEILAAKAAVSDLGAGAVADLTSKMAARFTAANGSYFVPARMILELASEGRVRKERIDLQIAGDNLPAPLACEVLDGRTITLPVFRQKGNQGGGGSIQRTVTEGQGNANGILEPGETATIWVKLGQGLDPFDKGAWYRTRVYTDSPWITEIDRLEEQKQLEWTGAKELTSVIRLSPDTPPGTEIPLLLDNESWSYTFTPDVRYGKEPLYQAYEFHARHLHRMTLKVGAR